MRKSSLFLFAFAAVALVPALAFASPDAGTPDILKSGWTWAFLSAFGWGFLTSLTPCVYPMVPIIISVFGAKDESVTRRKAMVLATCFVLGICTLYTALGVGFALAGKASNELLANPYVMVPMALILIALAASMFGAFEIRLPQGLQQKLNTVGGKGYGGAFLLGLVLGIVAAPCTTGFSVSIMLLISTGQNVIMGGAVMFVYALGMGVLFWILAVFAVGLPKSGAWMEVVKSVGGIILIVMAGYFLIPIFPAIGDLGDSSSKFLVATIFIAVLGFAIGGAHLTFHGKPAEKIRKSLGIVMAVAGLLGALNWYLTPDRDVEWRYDEPAAYAEARQAGKHVMVDFGAEWCVPCKEIEKIIGDDDNYDDIVGSFVPLKIDVTDQDEEDERMQEKYGAPILPAVIFLDADGNELGRYTNKSPDTDSFRAALRAVVKDHPL